MQLDPLVKPRSIAIVGATDRAGPARSVIESLGAIGFTGPIYPVNPKYQTVRNLVCYPSLTDLPQAPDVVVFSIRKPLLAEQMRLAVDRGARAAVIYDAGFAELGEDGARQQAEIAGLCREAGMPVCGPNCMGILNPTARSTTYKQTVMDGAGLAGNVAIVSQSGSVCIALLSDLRRYGVSLSVSAGNEAVTTTVDYLDYLIDDPATKVIATFTETVREVRAQYRHGFPKLCLVSAYDGGEQRAVPAQDARFSEARDPGARRATAPARGLAPVRPEISARTIRRPTAARRTCARPSVQSGCAAARRAAGRARQEFARADASGAQTDPSRGRHHDGLCHA